MPLCQECQNFDLQSFRDDSYMQRGYAYSDVIERAACCSFCDLLRNSFSESTHIPTWIHFELLTTGRKGVQRGAECLQTEFIRLSLGERRYVRIDPSWAAGSREFPRGQKALLYVCADEGKYFH